MSTKRRTPAFLLVLFLTQSVPAHAYIGPGAALSAFGAAAALIGAVLLAVVGFLWYPLKRVWRTVASRRSKASESAENSLSR